MRGNLHLSLTLEISTEERKKATDWSFDYPRWGIPRFPEGDNDNIAFAPGANVQFAWYADLGVELTRQKKYDPGKGLTEFHAAYKAEVVVELWLWDILKDKPNGKDGYKGLQWKFDDRTQLIRFFVNDEGSDSEMIKYVSWMLPTSPLGQLDPNIGNSEAFTLLVMEYLTNGDPIIMVSNAFKVDYGVPVVSSSRTRTSTMIITAFSSTSQTSSVPEYTTIGELTSASIDTTTTFLSSSPLISTRNSTNKEVTPIDEPETPTTIITPMPTTLRRTDLPTVTPDGKPSNSALPDIKSRSSAGFIGGVVAGILVLFGVVWAVTVYRRRNNKRSTGDRADTIASPIKPWYLSPVPKLVMDNPHTTHTPVILQMTESEGRK